MALPAIRLNPNRSLEPVQIFVWLSSLWPVLFLKMQRASSRRQDKQDADKQTWVRLTPALYRSPKLKQAG